MPTVLSLLAISLLGAVPELSLAPRTPAAIVVLAPFGQTRTVSISGVVDAAARAFADHTDIRLIPPSQSGVDPDRIMKCPADRRLSCWLSAVDPQLRFMLLVSLGPSASGDLAAMTWIDLKKARQSLDNPAPEKDRDEAAIDLSAVPLRDLEAVFEKLVSVRLRDSLKRSGNYHLHGTLELTHECVGCTLHIGDQQFELTPQSKLRIRNVPAGPLKLEFVAAERSLCTMHAEIRRGASIQLDSRASCSPPSRDSSQTMRAVVEWTGVGAGTVGLGLLAWSLVLAVKSPSSVCLTKSNGSQCNPVQLPNSGLSGVEGTQIRTTANRGLPVFALGLGLATTGGAWWLGGRYTPESLWWVPATVGLILGGTSFALSYGLGHR